MKDVMNSDVIAFIWSWATAQKLAFTLNRVNRFDMLKAICTFTKYKTSAVLTVNVLQQHAKQFYVCIWKIHFCELMRTYEIVHVKLFHSLVFAVNYFTVFAFSLFLFFAHFFLRWLKLNIKSSMAFSENILTWTNTVKLNQKLTWIILLWLVSAW